MLKYRTLLILLVSLIVMCNVGIAYACLVPVKGGLREKYDLKITSVSTRDEAGNTENLKAIIVGEECVLWCISNAYPGEVAYLKMEIKNVGNKPIKMDGVSLTSTNRVKIEESVTYSKTVINPGETIISEVKIEILTLDRNSRYNLFQIKLKAVGVC